ncbi:MAG: hypothetical protein QOI47_2482 [Actinomycetota bacterium]|nr:hypothetical protein [Actinomycetota bacterium]
MSRLVTFGRFWYDFIVGDDWTVAVTVAVAVGVTYAAAHHDIVAWWILPAAVVATLAASVLRARRAARGARAEP